MATAVHCDGGRSAFDRSSPTAAR
jgi:uncharacterized protein